MHTNSCGKFFLAIGEPFKYYIAEFSFKEGGTTNWGSGQKNFIEKLEMGEG